MLAEIARAAVRPKLVPVFVRAGDSNSIPSGSDVTDIPNNYWPPDPNAFFHDARGALGPAGTIQRLIPPSYSTVTVTIASPGVFTWTAHGLVAGAPVVLKTTGALPTGLAVSTTYFVVSPAADTFSLAATRGGAAINTSGTQSGVHTAVANIGLEQQPVATISSNSFPSCGPAFEQIRQWRVEHPTGPVFIFNIGYGGGGFTDLASNGRAVNWLYDLTDGAYANALSHWRAFVAGLAAMGYKPDVKLCAISLGGNDALNGASATHQTNKTNLIAQMRIDMIGNAKVLLERVNNTSQTALSGVIAGVNTIRAGDQAIVQADPARVEMLNTDGFTCITDNLHWAMSTHVPIGERGHYHAQGLWYTMKEFAFSGGNPVTHLWRFGSFQNIYASATALQTVADIGGISAYAPTQATGAKQPTIGSTTIANGLPIRSATGVGGDDVLTYTGGANLGATYAIFALMSGPSTASKVAMSEGGSTATPNVMHLLSAADGSGKLTHIVQRDDASSTTLTFTLAAFNGNKNAIVKWESGGSVNCWVNGTTDTPQSYTRGTITLAHTSFFANETGGSVALNMLANIDEIGALAAVPDATWLANFLAYAKRRGTV